VTAHDQILELKTRMQRSIIGQEDVIDRLIIGVLADGNLLVESLPRLAPTREIKSVVKDLATDFSRIQFTPAHSTLFSVRIIYVWCVLCV
jgi:MoxR-like ATPase